MTWVYAGVGFIVGLTLLYWATRPRQVVRSQVWNRLKGE